MNLEDIQPAQRQIEQGTTLLLVTAVHWLLPP